jgi:hypothetical protein
MRKRIQHIWSLVSFLITIVHVLVLYGISEFLYRRGIKMASSPYSVDMAWLHIIAILLSVLTAGVAIAKERPRVIGVLVLFLGLFSYLFYVG